MAYLTNNQLDARLEALKASKPALVSIADCDHTTAGDPDPANNIPGRKPRFLRINYPRPPRSPRIPVLIIGGVHAREWAPPDALVSFAEKMAAAVGLGPLFPVDAVTYPPFRKTAMENEGLNRRPVPGAPPIPFPSVVIARDAVESIFDRLDIYILPLVNPDGRAFTLSGIDRPSRMWWRKNRKAPTPAVGPCRDDHNLDVSQGVDINRNFDIAFKIEDYYSTAYLNQRDRWGEPKVVTSTVPCPDSLPPPPGTTLRIPAEFGHQYRGRAAESEAETKNVISPAGA